MENSTTPSAELTKDAIGEKPELALNFTAPDMTGEPQAVRMEDILGNVATAPATPTWTPRKFSEQFAIYNSALWMYDFNAGAWLSTPITPITVANGGTGVSNLYTANADAATITFDMSNSKRHMVTLGGNRILAVSNVSVGDVFLVRLLQDGSGSRTVTWWSGIKWANGGGLPGLTTTNGKADLYGFFCTAAGAYDGFIVGSNI